MFVPVYIASHCRITHHANQSTGLSVGMFSDDVPECKVKGRRSSHQGLSSCYRKAANVGEMHATIFYLGYVGTSEDSRLSVTIVVFVYSTWIRPFTRNSTPRSCSCALLSNTGVKEAGLRNGRMP